MSARPGYPRVVPRIVCEDVVGLVAFLWQVVGAEGALDLGGGPVELRIGDAMVMVSQAGERDAFPAFLYVYVDDVQAAYDEALSLGATSIEAPLVTPYGDLRAMVRDPWGDVLQLASATVDLPG